MALGILVLVVALAMLSPLALLATGTVVALGGLLLSVAVGVSYHRRLLAAVSRVGGPRAGWWWAPSRLHGNLDEAGKSTVLPAWRAGVATAMTAIAGLVLVALAAGKAWLLAR